MGLEAGIYDVLNFKTYREQKDWVSISELNVFDRAPICYKHEILDGNKRESSKQQDLGTALHTYFLEPKVWSDIYRVADAHDKRTVAGKAVAAEIKKLEAELGCIFLSQAEYDKVRFAGDALDAHPFIKDIKPTLKCESSMFWRDLSTGVACKGRLDSYSDDYCAIFDVKTTKSAKYFSQSVADYSYHRQAAFYLDGLFQTTGKSWSTFTWLTVEMDAPHLCAVYTASDEMIKRGRDEYQALLQRYKRCHTMNNWPGLSTEITELNLPAYMMGKAIEI